MQRCDAGVMHRSAALGGVSVRNVIIGILRGDDEDATDCISLAPSLASAANSEDSCFAWRCCRVRPEVRPPRLNEFGLEYGDDSTARSRAAQPDTPASSVCRARSSPVATARDQEKILTTTF